MDAVDYRFLNRDEFDRQSREGAFLESAEVHGEWYGTLTRDVENVLNSGRDILLEIDVQGALQIKKKIPESILLFVSPPSMEVLERRLRERGTENEDLLQTRRGSSATASPANSLSPLRPFSRNFCTAVSRLP